MVDKVRQQIVDAQARRIDDRLIQELRHGDILKVIEKADIFGISKAAIHRFFSEQWQRWQSQIIQNYETFASEATVEPPDMGGFYETDPNNAFKGNDGTMVLEGMLKGAKASTVKAAGVGKAEEGAEAPISLQDLDQMARETISEWDGFMNELWSSVLDAQLVKEYESRMGEIMREVQRLIALAKSGQVGPEFVLIALAKVNSTKNGVLFAWLSKKAFAVNEDMNRITEELTGMQPTDSRYFATLQDVQQKTRAGSFQLNMITNDMQKVMQDVSSTMESVHGMMRMIFQTRREIIAKTAAR